MAPDDNTDQGNLPVSRDEKFILNVRETVLKLTLRMNSSGLNSWLRPWP
jgi:hypothetical protein